MSLEIWLALFAATIQSGTPILYATLGEVITEKSGVLNLGIEGIMLCGALAAFWVSLTTGNPVMGVFGGGFAGLFISALHGLVCITFLGNQVVSGLALTILGTGLANYLGNPLVGMTAPGFDKFAMPVLSKIPVLGSIFFNQDVLVYFSYLLPPLIFLFFQRTRWGLNLRSAGENPEAASTTGLNVIGLRWTGTLVGGFLVGIGGAYLSLAYTHLWTSGLTSGRGWIAVALVIFAFWHPGRAVLGAYLFGGVMAFQFRLQAMGTNLPSSLLQMLPYLLTVIVVIVSSARKGRDEAPAALGINIEPHE